MSSVNRFIQFNNETVNTKKVIQLERLAKALSRAPYLMLTTRKLMEFRPKEGAISISHFWKHREADIEQKGQLSDLYLLTAGFWRHFDLEAWNRYEKQTRQFTIKEFALQLALMAEEFRLSNLIRRERPGTEQAFAVREEVYSIYHEQQSIVNLQKGFMADSLFSFLYVSLHKGTLAKLDESDYPEFFMRILPKWQFLYDSKSTSGSCAICMDILFALEEEVKKDLTHTFISIHENLQKPAYPEKTKNKLEQHGSSETQESNSIEEMFATWHRESEKQKGPHMEFELTKGNKGKIDNGSIEEGDDSNEIQSEGSGSSAANRKNEQTGKKENAQKINSKQSGERFGNEHLNVTYEEQKIELNKEPNIRENVLKIRGEQRPFVKALTKEIKKRIEQKQESTRTNLSKGRLSPRLTSLVTERRPKPFYKKNSPSTPLDAVFGLLVDSSASMIDKMEETRKAVLLFHDVLRDLAIPHDIVSYFEDAYEATALEQPNKFLFCHQMKDNLLDDAQAILSMEAHEDNRDGLAIRWMAERLGKRGEKHKFILLFSDGEPSAFGYAENGIIDTAEAVMEVEKNGIHLLHLFLSTEAPVDEQLKLFQMIFGSKTASAKNVDDFTTQTLRLLRKMLYIVVK